ncbi:SPW repeat protein, partial [Streptomyces sp. NPDC001982]|uniref:SPW repeat domain-containing protein n=1 Tax=Streptomyces sp. NPDC001982 TaxID=3154405 RepID=UPI003331CD4E
GDVSTTKTIVNNVIVGVIALLLALTAASIGRSADRATSGRMSAPYAGGRS